MEKPHYKEWLVDFKGKTIKVTNWWNWNMEGSADLFIDDEHVDQNTDMTADPNLPLLTKNEFSENIKSIEVFDAGAWYYEPFNKHLHSNRKLYIKDLFFEGVTQIKVIEKERRGSSIFIDQIFQGNSSDFRYGKWYTFKNDILPIDSYWRELVLGLYSISLA